ncbi:MAG: endosialidase [Lachnospiraceae bacterium]|nr:endosialidase [Lachnospiraceae bacterium]
MAVIKNLIQTEADGSISFGNYELSAKKKVSDYEHEGNLYKVKTFSDITRLERNEMFVYESVPGTAVSHLRYTDRGMEFTVEGPKDAQITVEGESGTFYDVYINDEAHASQKASLGGKISFSVELANEDAVSVRIERA